MPDYTNMIIKILQQMSGKYSAYEIFSDWVKCCSLAISNNCDILRGRIWQERERAYIETMKKYTREEGKKFVKMFALLTETLEFEMKDVLGEIYMKSGMGSKAAGQFFTPYHLCLACAKLSIFEPNENGKYLINEPSSGGGAMIIAAAAVLKERGVDYKRDMEVVAQDLDWKGVYMSYLQLSLLGIKAVCVQGNTLSEPYRKGYPEERVLRTPMMRILL